MDSPQSPFTWLAGAWLESSAQKVLASEDENVLSHWLDAPKPEIVWYVVVASTVVVVA